MEIQEIALIDYDNEALGCKVSKVLLLSKEESILDIIPEREYTPKTGDKIYFVPGCTVPRFKMRQFCEKYKTAIVKYKEKANTIIVGEDTVVNLTYITSGMCYNKSYIIDFFKKKYLGQDAIIKTLEENVQPYVFMSWEAYRHFNDANTFDEKQEVYLNVRTFKDQDSYELFINLKDNPSLYGQDKILRLINTGGVMDEEKYESVKRLFESDDKENIKLGMETIANLDYEKSCVYLLFLIKDYGLKMFNSGNRNHVNFKALLNFFNITNLSHYQLHNIIDSLLVTRLLNQTNLDKLKPYINKAVDSVTIADHFTIKEIKYSEEIEDCLNNNVLDKKCNTEIVYTEDQVNPRMPLAAL